MTESGMRRVEEKLDKISDTIGEVKVEIQKLKTTVENIPKIEEEKHKNVDNRLLNHSRRLDGLEANQRWVILAILGIVLQAIMSLVLK